MLILKISIFGTLLLANHNVVLSHILPFFIRNTRTTRNTSTHTHSVQCFCQVPATCVVKIKVTDLWTSLLMSRTHGVNSFITHALHLSKSPPTIVSCPPVVEEIWKRIHFVEGRIILTNRIDALLTLRDDVYRNRQKPFHWDLFLIIELNSQQLQKLDVIDSSSPKFGNLY